MAKRRANGEGSIRKRPDGRWEGRYTAGRDPETGKTVYKNVLGKTQAEVKVKLKQAIQESTEVDALKAAQYTVGQWMDIWFENYAKIKVRPTSHQTYSALTLLLQTICGQLQHWIMWFIISMSQMVISV